MVGIAMNAGARSADSAAKPRLRSELPPAQQSARLRSK